MLPLITNSFDPISLENMSAVKLMNRIDTKYVTTMDKLCGLLSMLSQDYYIQDNEGVRCAPYHTVYFDTPELHMFNTHQCGVKRRQKIRMRTYVNSDMHFLEIKRKNNKGRTRKKRISIDNLTPDTGQYADFISEHSIYVAERLERQVENHFNRITLVNRNFTERLTIDTGLRFHNFATGLEFALPNIAVIELKRDGAIPSPAVKHLLAMRIQPSGFSKYCMGMVFTNPAVRRNRFKERVRNVLKMNSSPSLHYTPATSTTFNQDELNNQLSLNPLTLLWN